MSNGFLLMPVLSQPFLHAAGGRLPDVLELTVTQVEKQFLHRTACLCPGMTPCVGLVQPLLVGHMLYHITGMAERELYLVALHGENLPVGTGSGLDASREMGAVGRKTEVVHHVLRGHDGKA